jgi:single-strand DNA-binding protein
MLNKVTAIGRITKKPEVKYSKKGSAFSNFSIACNEKYKQNGEWQERTEFINLSMFGKRLESLSQYLDKGKLIYIEGSLKTDKYKDRNDVEKYITKVIVSDIKFMPNGGNKSKAQQMGYEEDSQDNQVETAEDISDEDIPF